MSWYLMHRGWQDNPVFKDQPYTEREAWEWLISEATYEQKTVNFKGVPVSLERGQVTHSLRFLAEKFKWPKSSVERFLEKLKKWDMVQVETGTGQNIITICNYEQYQTMRDSGGTQTGRKPGRKRDSGGTINNSDNKDNSVNEIPPKPPKGGEHPDFEIWYREYPHKVGRGGAAKAFSRAIKLADLETLLTGLRGYMSTKPPDRSWCNPSTWLNEKRWLDKPQEIEHENARTDSAKYNPTRALELALADQTHSNLRTGGGDYCPDAPALPKPPDGPGCGDNF